MKVRARCPACGATSPAFDPAGRGGTWAWWIKHRVYECTAEGEPLPEDPPLEVVA